MNTRNIEPKKVWTSQGEQDATILSLINFSDYHFDDGGGMVTYKLITMKSPGTTTDDDGNVIDLPQTAEDLFTGYITIPSSVISQWGQSDQIIWDFICTQLSIVLLP